MVTNLEDICIYSFLSSVNTAVAKSGGGPECAQQHYRRLLGETLGGVSSINLRKKMMDRLEDVKFLVHLSQVHVSGRKTVVGAINKVIETLLSVILAPDILELRLNCKTLSSDLQDMEDTESDSDSSDSSDLANCVNMDAFHLNLTGVIDQVGQLYSSPGKVSLNTLDLQGCYTAWHHRSFQSSLTRLFTSSPPSSFNSLTNLILRDFAEPPRAPGARFENRARLCQAIGRSCHNLETLNMGNIDVGAILHMFIKSATKSFPSLSPTSRILVYCDPVPLNGKTNISIRESLDVPSSDLSSLCSSLRVLVLSLRDVHGSYSGLSLSPFFIHHLPHLQNLHMNGVDNAVVGGLAVGLTKGTKTHITSADWFNPDILKFHKKLGLQDSFSFQDGLELLSEKCPHLSRLTTGKTLFLEFTTGRIPRIPQDQFTCTSLLPLNKLKHLNHLTIQCISSKILVPLIRDIGSQLKFLGIRLHMQARGELSNDLLEICCPGVDYTFQVTGRPLTRGDLLRHQTFVQGGFEAVQGVELQIMEEGLDQIILEEL